MINIRVSNQKISATNRTIIGNDNVITGDENVIIGNGNTIFGNKNDVNGNYNIIEGLGNHVQGIDNSTKKPRNKKQDPTVARVVNYGGYSGNSSGTKLDSTTSVSIGDLVTSAMIDQNPRSANARDRDGPKDAGYPQPWAGEPSAAKDDQKRCIKCNKRAAIIVAIPCMHVDLCNSCCLIHKMAHCPKCKRHVEKYTRIV